MSGRIHLSTDLLPENLVAEVAGWIADIPSLTVKALIESLQHDMVARDRRWIGALVANDYVPITTRDAIVRSLVEPQDAVPDADRDPMQRLLSDPEWAG